MTRRRFEWRFGHHKIPLGERTQVAGVVQIAPERQDAGSRDPMDGDRAFALAMEMEEAGADLLLISSEAWLPGVKRITEAEELRRVSPVIKRLRDRITIPWGLETDKAAIAERAFDAGASVIFDPAGLTTDPALPKLISQRDGGLIVGHLRGAPETWAKLPPVKEPIPGLLIELDAGLNRGRRGGIPRMALLADPGLGYGKRREQNIEVLAHLKALDRLDAPIAVGFPELPPAAATVAVLMGAHLLRTPDVAAVRSAADLADAILAAAAPKADSVDSGVYRAGQPRT
jgi:dihydropteroate synthase